MSKGYTLDTKGHLVLCPKLSPKLQIPIQDCVECEYHKAIYEVFPGKINEDTNKQEPFKVNIDDVSIKPFGEKDMMKQYNIECGLPRGIRAVLYASIKGGE